MPYGLDIKIVGAEQAVQFYKKLAPATELAIYDAFNDLADVAIMRIRNIIEAADAFDSGRLLASVPIRKNKLSKDNRDNWEAPTGREDPDNPASSDDVMFEIKKEGGLYLVRIGTNVPYGDYIEEGFNMIGPRVVRFPDGSFRTVHTFYFPGIYAFAASLAGFNKLFNIYIGHHLKKVGWTERFKYVGEGRFASSGRLLI